jgi:hypothetical protein
MIVIVVESFFVTTDYIQPAVVGYANMNIEAILQDNTVKILSPEEKTTQMFVEQTSNIAEAMPYLYTDKELPAT